MANEIDSQLRDTIRGIRLVVFDFDGVFTDNAVYVSQDGTESVRCWRGDGLGLRKLDRLGIANMVLSTETNPVVSKRCEKLKIPCIQGCNDKRAEMERIAAEQQLALAQIAFMGNDINDAPVLEIVGLPVVVQDAHPSVVPLACHRTQTPGGYGAVRELCDLFEQVFTDNS